MPREAAEGQLWASRRATEGPVACKGHRSCSAKAVRSFRGAVGEAKGYGRFVEGLREARVLPKAERRP